MSPEQQIWTEENKLLHDTLKQLVTISSGSVLILIAFKEKLFTIPRWQWLIVLSFAGFFLCIIVSLILMRNISLDLTANPKCLPPKDLRHYRVVKYSFLSAVGALVLFVIVNLVFGVEPVGSVQQ